MKKTLIIYYSRTGTTKKLAEAMAKKLNADIEEIVDLKNRNGAVGWLASGKDAMKKNLTKIKDLNIDLEKYDTIIIGSPIWAGTIPPAIRTFLINYKSKFKNIILFCTSGSGNSENFFKEIENLLNKKPKAILSLITKEINCGYEIKLNEFIKNIK